MFSKKENLNILDTDNLQSSAPPPPFKFFKLSYSIHRIEKIDIIVYSSLQYELFYSEINYRSSNRTLVTEKVVWYISNRISSVGFFMGLAKASIV